MVRIQGSLPTLLEQRDSVCDEFDRSDTAGDHRWAIHNITLLVASAIRKTARPPLNRATLETLYSTGMQRMRRVGLTLYNLDLDRATLMCRSPTRIRGRRQRRNNTVNFLRSRSLTRRVEASEPSGPAEKRPDRMQSADSTRTRASC